MNQTVAKLSPKDVNQKIWVNKGSQFYNRSLKLWSETNDIEMYSTHNKGKFVVAENLLEH